MQPGQEKKGKKEKKKEEKVKEKKQKKRESTFLSTDEVSVAGAWIRCAEGELLYFNPEQLDRLLLSGAILGDLMILGAAAVHCKPLTASAGSRVGPWP